MGRPASTDGRAPLNMRVPSELLGWLQGRASRHGVATSVEGRVVLDAGRDCLLGECPAQEELDKLRPPAGLAPLPNLEATFVLESDPRECLPSNMRHLDDKALLRFNICPQHLIDRAECVHEHEDPA